MIITRESSSVDTRTFMHACHNLGQSTSNVSPSQIKLFNWDVVAKQAMPLEPYSTELSKHISSIIHHHNNNIFFQLDEKKNLITEKTHRHKGSILHAARTC